MIRAALASCNCSGVFSGASIDAEPAELLRGRVAAPPFKKSSERTDVISRERVLERGLTDSVTLGARDLAGGSFANSRGDDGSSGSGVGTTDGPDEE